MTTKKKTGTTTTKKTTATKSSRDPRPAAKKKAAAPQPAPSKATAKPAPRPPAPVVKAKPAKNPLNKKEMEPYRRLLLDLKAKLVREVLVNQEASNESTDGDVLDLADQASDSYDKDLANSLSETERARLAAVENALKRVTEGSYGLCDSCGKPIPLGRLKVLPFVKLCVPCQQDEEKSGGGRASTPEE